MRDFRVGLLGLGRIGRVHAYAISVLPHYYNMPYKVTLAGVYNRTYEKAQDAVDRLGFEFAAKTPDDLIGRSDIDAVSICLPNHEHEEYALKVLDAGKHLYLEKPLCIRYEGALRIKQAAEKAGVKVQLVFHNRFFPAVMRAKQLMEQGQLGTLLGFEAHYYHATNVDADKPFSWRFSRAYAGGGALFDLGSHVIDLVTYLAGGIKRLNAALHTAVGERPCEGGAKCVDVDDAVFITAQLNNGAMGTIAASKLATGTSDELLVRFFGEKGAIGFSTERPNHLAYYDNTDTGGAFGGSKGVKLIEAYQRFDTQDGAIQLPKMGIGWTRAHVHAMHTFFDCISSGKDCSPSVIDGVYNQLVLEKVYESAQKGAWVSVG